MPNWCDNSLTVSHPDKEMMAKFAEGIHNGNLFETFIPMPAELRETTSPSEANQTLIEKYGASDWYSWAVENWGTKWDVCDGDFNLEEDGLSGSGWFNTAWGPPISAYEKLQELGFSIDAIYHECGMGFAGTWVDGDDDYIDNYYELFEQEKWQDQVENDELRNLLECEYESWLFDRIEEEMKDGTQSNSNREED